MLVNNVGNRRLLEGLAVVDDGNHVLYVTLRQLSVPQVLLFVGHRLLPVPAHTRTRVSNCCSLFS